MNTYSPVIYLLDWWGELFVKFVESWELLLFKELFKLFVFLLSFDDINIFYIFLSSCWLWFITNKELKATHLL